jgi:hypothetical protein
MTQSSTQATPPPEEQTPKPSGSAVRQTEAEKKAIADKASAQNANVKS